MRILMLTDLYPPVAFGGYERECAVLVDGLRGRGHEVRVLTSDLDRDRAPLDDQVERALPWNHHGRLQATLLAPWRSAHAAEVLRRSVAEVHPHVIVAFNLLGVPQASLLAAFQSGRPVALRLAETYFATSVLSGDRYLRYLAPGQQGVSRAWAAVARIANRAPALRLDPAPVSATWIAWGSAALRDAVGVPRGLHVVEDRVIHPATPHAGALAALVRQSASVPTVLYVGRVTAGKGIDDAYRGLARLRQAHGIGARLIVAGHSDEATLRRLDRLAEELGISDAVHHHGQLAEDRLTRLFAQAHVLLVPSLVPDVFPLVVVEAALARLPVVASRVGGIPEAVVDQEHALLFEPGDVEGCAAALASTFQAPEETARRATRAYGRMTARASDAYVLEWLELLDAAAALRTSRP